ncbi:MAG: hypothetical protein KAS66_08995 [Candidatus Omnitrophica bacterium]|nr:hypothetical protein [Candidatus Omnitrophota bacterium]
MNEDFPKYYDYYHREEIIEGVKLLSAEDRNALLLEKCKKAMSLMEKYNSGTRGHLRGWIEHEMNYINCMEGFENKFIENQISHLIFEKDQLMGVTMYLHDPRGLRIAMKTIERIFTSLIEELTPYE